MFISKKKYQEFITQNAKLQSELNTCTVKLQELRNKLSPPEVYRYDITTNIGTQTIKAESYYVEEYSDNRKVSFYLAGKTVAVFLHWNSIIVTGASK